MSVNVEALKAQLKRAQAEAAKAVTPLEMVNAQEEVDALYDRIEKAVYFEKAAPAEPTAADAVLLAKLKVMVGDNNFPVDTQSWKQIEVHEE